MTEVLHALALATPTRLQRLPVELPVSPDVFVVLALVAVALVLFVLQPVSIDTTAIALMVALILLGPVASTPTPRSRAKAQSAAETPASGPPVVFFCSS